MIKIDVDRLLLEMTLHSSFGQTVMVIIEKETNDEDRMRHITRVFEAHRTTLNILGKVND